MRSVIIIYTWEVYNVHIPAILFIDNYIMLYRNITNNGTQL